MTDDDRHITAAVSQAIGRIFARAPGPTAAMRAYPSAWLDGNDELVCITMSRREAEGFVAVMDADHKARPPEWKARATSPDPAPLVLTAGEREALEWARRFLPMENPLFAGNYYERQPKVRAAVAAVDRLLAASPAQPATECNDPSHQTCDPTPAPAQPVAPEPPPMCVAAPDPSDERVEYMARWFHGREEMRTRAWRTWEYMDSSVRDRYRYFARLVITGEWRIHDPTPEPGERP